MLHQTLLLGALALCSVAAAGPTVADDGQDGEAATGTAKRATSVVVGVPAGADVLSPQGSDPTGGLPDDAEYAPGDTPSTKSSGEWLVVPIPFSSPLLGAGLKGGVARLYRPAAHPAQPRMSMFGVGGMYAEGGSWAIGGGDRRYWGDGRIRTTIAGGASEIYYALDLTQGRQVPVRQQVWGGALVLDYEVRKNLWIGGGFKYGHSTATIRESGSDTGDPPLPPSQEFQTGILGLTAKWDSRSDEFYPTDGMLADAHVDIAAAALGSNTNYVKYKLAYNGYREINESHTLAWRVAGEKVTGDPPFFVLPWFGSGVDLRGYTPGVYIGKSLYAVQAEWRWQATRRFGLVAFAGVGGVDGEVKPFQQESWLPAGGLGLRWRVTNKNRVNFRIDYGWGRNDETLIVSAGEAF